MFLIHSILGSRKQVAREQAVVVDVRDPDKQGRIKVASQTLGETGWIPYIMAPGQFSPPKWGDIVYIECEDGDSSYPIAHGRKVNRNRDLEGVPGALYREVPTVTALWSNGFLLSNGVPANSTSSQSGFPGHVILLDDGQQTYGAGGASGNAKAGMKLFSFGGAKIILSDEAGNQKILISDFNNTSTPTALDTTSGNRILIDSEADTIEMTDVNGNTVKLSKDEILIQSPAKKVVINGATEVDVNTAKCVITTSGETDIQAGGKVVINGSEIDLNGSAGDVLTKVTDPVVDEIFGTPTVGVPTVKAG